MKTEAPAIATTELVWIRRSGERTPITVEIGQPFQTPDRTWRTPLALHGLDGRLSDICGGDSLQSLCLAIEMVHRRLVSVIHSGDRFEDPDGGEFAIDVFFPRD